MYGSAILTVVLLRGAGTKNASAKTSYLFLRKELPVRFANIMKEFHLLPEPLVSQPSLRLVEKWLEL